MGVSVDEAGQDGLAAEVDLPGVAGGQSEDFVVGSDGKEASVGDGDGLSFGLVCVDGPEVSVVEDEFGLGAVYGDERESAHGA